jgi:DNA mismatch repair protein MSH4
VFSNCFYQIFIRYRYSESRGYHLAIPDGTALPSDFIHPAKSGRFITCTTEEVMSLNLRANDNIQDLLFMTNDKIQEVLDLAREKYDALASLSDAVAILDMCVAFADNVSSNNNSKLWCRPTVKSPDTETNGKSNGLMIENGRYAIDMSQDAQLAPEGPQDFVANDTYTTNNRNFTIITGINGSGEFSLAAV